MTRKTLLACFFALAACKRKGLPPQIEESRADAYRAVCAELHGQAGSPEGIDPESALSALCHVLDVCEAEGVAPSEIAQTVNTHARKASARRPAEQELRT